MLTSTNLHLRALAPGELPNSTGRFGHAAFLALIESVAPELSQVLHDRNARQPFTVSPLRVPSRNPSSPPIRKGSQREVNECIRVYEGDSCSMRFSVIEGDDPDGAVLFRSFQTALITTLPAATIRLHNIPFAVEEAHTTPGADGWTGYTTFAELLECAATERTVALHFESPTAMSLGQTDAGKRFELFPVPWNVFDGLARKWTEFGGVPLRTADFLEWVQECVWVSEHDVQTRILQFGRFSQKGFVGTVVYEIKRGGSDLARMLNALADLALYAGVGYKTTMGMGQARRVK